jgi:hypothetical protein
LQLVVCILGSFMETDDAGNEDISALEVGNAALDVVETDAD